MGTTPRLRALAHPLRLQMLSLLTGTAMSAAEVARELNISHANASYHLRQLLAAGEVEIGEEVVVRGGRAHRYRYRIDPTDHRGPAPVAGANNPEDRSVDAGRRQLLWAAFASELRRRAALQDNGPASLTDAELWVEPAVVAEVRALVNSASTRLHDAAQPPRTPETERVSLSIAMFGMRDDT